MSNDKQQPHIFNHYELLNDLYYVLGKGLEVLKDIKEKQRLRQEQDWEIECFRCGNSNYWLQKSGGYHCGVLEPDVPLEKILKWDNTTIHSVRRKSDGVVFTVGDKCSLGVNPITGFKIEDGKIKVLTNGAGNWQWLSSISKLPVVLFTTEDGQPVYIGKTYWKVTPMEQCWKADETIMRKELANPPSYFKYFSTKEAAEQYILENKPFLSFNDVRGYLDWNKFTEFEQKAKEKLKQ